MLLSPRTTAARLQPNVTNWQGRTPLLEEEGDASRPRLAALGTWGGTALAFSIILPGSFNEQEEDSLVVGLPVYRNTVVAVRRATAGR